MTTLESEIQKRRTFAIISHPDAGKTTLTEKLLLFGGAIQQAGAIKAKKATKFAASDWMELEKQRGVSVATSVMCFAYQDYIINLLDTPGHADFSEDTYRTLTAVDSVLMVIDSVKGVEERTRKLMDVCKLRHIPVITFINKLDREGQNPFDLLDNIEKELAITAVPLSWPISMGKTFKGIYNMQEKRLLKFKPGDTSFSAQSIEDIESPQFFDAVGADHARQLKEDLAMINGALSPFSLDAYLKGQMTPVFFGSAVNNFGVQELLNSILSLAPSPLPHPANERVVSPEEEKMTGLVFKIHANMDPKHRDRIAFMRVNSGIFTRGMKVKHVRLDKEMKIANPMTFMAQARSIIEEAYPGDIIGIHDTGSIKIGDTFTEKETLNFSGIPSFSPEIFCRVLNKDPMRSKPLQKGLIHLSEEGAIQVFSPLFGNDPILGAVGILQLDVVKFRLENEYAALCHYETHDTRFAYWVQCPSVKKLEEFKDARRQRLAMDTENKLAYLFQGHWELTHMMERFPDMEFYKTSECKAEDRVHA